MEMERAEGLLGGKSLFKSQNDGTIDKTEVVCSKYTLYEVITR